ncbi:MAG TPA: helix-turn-helix domain-containing protein [Longimicrobium sp.]|jgi:excisionase family DNA binding protein
MATVESSRELLGALDPSATAIDRQEAERSAAALQGLPEGATVTVSAPGGFQAALPPAVVAMVATLLYEASVGHVVALVSAAPEVTTTQAASLLGVSRPHVTKLVDSGRLPARMAGSHRRIRLADLLRYKAERDRRRELIDEVVDMSQGMNLYELQAAERTPPRRLGS